MALLFCESFDHADINHLTSGKWSYQNSTPALSTGRNSGLAWFTTIGGGSRILGKILSSNYSTLIIGFAFRVNSSIGGSLGSNIFKFLDGTTQQVALWINTSMQLAVYRQGTLLGTGSTILSLNAWYYFEIKCVFATGTGGSITVKINTVSEIALTSINTAPSGVAQCNRFEIGTDNANSSNNTANSLYDDLYLCDTSGSKNNNYLGDVRIDAIFPNGVGNYSQFTNSAGNSTNNYSYIDENSGTYPNDDTDYIADGTINHRDSSTMSDLSTTPTTIYGIQVSAYVRKDDAGAKQFCTFLRTASTDYDNSAVFATDSYSYARSIHELNPNGSVDWTATTINSLELGIKVVS